MPSLKSYATTLAHLFGSTPATVYERQRALVHAGVLTAKTGRGPGSGVRLTPLSAAILLTAILATDHFTETEERVTQVINTKPPNGDACPLTAMPRFKDAIASALASESRASKVLSISVSRTGPAAFISFRRDRAEHVSRFVGPAAKEPLISVIATLSGDVFRAIARDVRLGLIPDASSSPAP